MAFFKCPNQIFFTSGVLAKTMKDLWEVMIAIAFRLVLGLSGTSMT